MRKQNLVTLTLLIFFLIVFVALIFLYTYKRSEKENQVVSLVETSIDKINLLGNLENAIQSNVQAALTFAREKKRGDVQLLESSLKTIHRYQDSVSFGFKKDPGLLQDLDSLTEYVNRRATLIDQLIATAKSISKKDEVSFFSGIPVYTNTNRIFALIRLLRQKTLLQLQNDEESNSQSVKQIRDILALWRWLTLFIALGIARIFFLHFSVNKRVQEQLKNYNLELEKQVTEKTATIRQSEERYRTLIEQASEAIIISDTNAKVLDVNDQACEMLGYSKEELCKMGVDDFMVYDNGEQRKYIYELLQRGESILTERKLKCSNGSFIFVESRSKKLSDNRIMSIVRDVTKRKQLEEALKDSEKKLNQVLTSSLDIFYAVDRNYRIILINDVAKKQLSIAWGKPVTSGANIMELIPENTNEKIQESFIKAFNGEVVKYEKKNIDENLPSWVAVNFYPVKDDEGEIVGASVITEDISKRKKAELELQRSFKRFELISKATNDAIWEWNLVTDQLWANETHQHLYGLTIDDPVPGQEKWLERIHPDDRYKILKIQEITDFSSTNVYTSEYRFYKEGMGYRNIFDRGYVLRDENGKPIRTLGSMMDITELRQAETAVKESEEKFRNLVEQSFVGVYIIQDGKFAYVNPRLAEMLGYKTEELIHSIDVLEIIHPDYRQLVADNISLRLAGIKDSIHYEAAALRKDSNVIQVELFGSRTDYLGRPAIIGATIDITLKKKAEEDLRKSEQRYRSLIEQATDFIMITDVKGSFIDANSSLCKAFGYTREELLTKNASDIIDPEQIKKDPIRFDLLMQGQNILRERRMISRDGTIIEVEANVKMLPDGRVLAIARDIRERKKAEAEIRLSINRFELISRTTNDALWEWDLVTGRLWANETHQQLYGLKISDPVPSQEMWLERIHPEDRLKILEKQNVALATKTNVFISEYRFNVEGKGYRDVYDRCYIVRDDKDIAIRMMGSFMDITELKLAAVEIKKAKELSDQLIDSVPGIFYLFNERGKYLRWNKQLELVTGYSHDEIAAMNPTDFYEGEELEYIKERIKGVFLHGENDAEAYFFTKDRRRIPYYFKAVRFVYENQVCLLGFGFDISDRKKAEMELEDSLIAIRHLSAHLQNIREAERTHIAREIHDELGQQLTVLKMDASWLNKKLTDADENVKQKLKDLLELMDNTVKTVRKISSELRPSLLDDMGLVSAMEWHLKEFEKRTPIKTQFKAPAIEVDLPEALKTGLFRIFQESLTNVARHANAKKVEINLQVEKNNIILNIKDDGKGFELAKAKEKKTLGILGMQERSYMIGGKYEVKSKPGKGTTVIVSVPFAQKDL